MAWIELHDTLPDHPKVIKLAKALNIDKDAVVGKLCRLWTWALNNRENGYFTDSEIETIAEVMRFKGNPIKLVDSLVAVGLMDHNDDNTYSIHDWDEHVEMLMSKRETKRQQARDRKRKQRDSHASVTRDNSVTLAESHANVTDEKHECHAVTVPKPYQNTLTSVTPLPPKGGTPKQKPKELTDEQTATFDALWALYPRKQSKQDAIKAFRQVDPSPDTVNAIKAALYWQKQSEDWTKDGGRFVPLFASYLRGKRWEDQPLTAVTPATTQGAPPKQSPQVQALYKNMDKLLAERRKTRENAIPPPPMPEAVKKMFEEREAK